ncbi:MAG: tetratricopeptide repeat protein [Anaerolineales bacterium]|nr:tetratricopeptide repeat protein [Anaerolineales bacterium]
MDNITLQQALVLFEKAHRLQMKGQFSEAIAMYKHSIEICPTAEAYTFLGWTYSMLGRYDEAIEMCEEAIHIDPEYGNPYNDIGSYLLELGRPEEALVWLEKATQATRYEDPQFPYLNMGRAYEKLGQYRSALSAYDQALAVKPVNVVGHMMKYALLGRMN